MRVYILHFSSSQKVIFSYKRFRLAMVCALVKMSSRLVTFSSNMRSWTSSSHVFVRQISEQEILSQRNRAFVFQETLSAEVPITLIKVSTSMPKVGVFCPLSDGLTAGDVVSTVISEIQANSSVGKLTNSKNHPRFVCFHSNAGLSIAIVKIWGFVSIFHSSRFSFPYDRSGSLLGDGSRPCLLVVADKQLFIDNHSLCEVGGNIGEWNISR